MTDTAPSPDNREFPEDLVALVASTLRNTGTLTAGVRAKAVLGQIFDYAEQVAADVKHLADALGLSNETIQAEPVPAVTPLAVSAEVQLPLRSVQEAIDTLSRVPIDARLGMAFSGAPEHQSRGYITSDDADRFRPRITIRWNEER